MMDIKFTAFEFWVSLDEDEPDLLADLAIGNWMENEAVQWLFKHSNIATHRINTPDDMCLHYKVVSTITPEKYTFWSLTYK